jgi:L-iditol 2-dehydrogenase
MRVGVYYNNNDVRVEERPVPAIGPDELLLKVRASGICGSDLMEWYRIKKAPLVLGHEVTGEIEAAGKNVKAWSPGQRVFVSHHVPCNACRYCLKGQHTVCETLHTTNFDPGGFSEYIRVPAINIERGVFALPDHVSYDEGSFIEPIGCTLRGQRLARLAPGDTVLVLGSGISGLLHVATARTQGAGKIIATDINRHRLSVAAELGANHTIDASKDVPALVRNANEGRLADLVIVSTGAPSAFRQALASVDRGGTILFFAPAPPEYELPLRITDIWRNGIILLPSYGAAPQDIQMAIDLIVNHQIPLEKMITHRIGLQDIGLGFKLVADAQDSLKVIVQPHD